MSLLSRRKAGLTQLRNDVRVTFSTESGQRVLTWLIAHCHLLETNRMERFDPYEMMFRDGERSVGLDILSFMQADWTAEQFMARVEETTKVMAAYFPEEKPSDAGA